MYFVKVISWEAKTTDFFLGRMEYFAFMTHSKIVILLATFACVFYLI